MRLLLSALGLMLLFEGLMPLLSPQQWRAFVAQVSAMRDGQIRFMGLVAVMLGAALLLFF